MVSVSDALEAEVAAVHAIWRQRPAGTAAASDERAGFGPRERAIIDRHFARLLCLLAPRIRHFIRAYRLCDQWEDAEQACAIGLLRAVQAYDPCRARFTTLVNWQLRGALQGLRHRIRLDARGSARAVGARTISIEGLLASAPDAARQFADEAALARTEALASDAMARKLCGTLLDTHFANPRHAASSHERAIVAAWLLGDEEARSETSGSQPGDGLTTEQRRQIARRTIRALAERVRASGDRFGGGELGGGACGARPPAPH